MGTTIGQNGRWGALWAKAIGTLGIGVVTVGLQACGHWGDIDAFDHEEDNLSHASSSIETLSSANKSWLSEGLRRDECVFPFSPLPAAHASAGHCRNETTAPGCIGVNDRSLDWRYWSAGSRGVNYDGHGSNRDYPTALGKKLYAMGRCVITQRFDGSPNCGNGLWMDCSLRGQTMHARYCHMNSLQSGLRAGTQLEIGAYVGEAGRTGNAVRVDVHLHLGLDVANKDVDSWFRTKECYNDPLAALEPQS